MPTYKYLHEYEPARPACDGKPSASPVYRSVHAKEGFPSVEFTTLFELFEQACAKYPNNECLGKRNKNEKGEVGPYVFKTYAEVHKEVAQIASALRSLGVEPGNRVCVFGANCPEWMIAMQACNRMSFQCVPLYDTLGENAVEYIINHSESVTAFVSTEKLPGLLKALPKTKATLKNIVYWGAGNQDAIKASKDLGYLVYSFAELSEQGAKQSAEPVPPKPSDLCTIMYTSGTTGDPKGVMLTHEAVVTSVCTARWYCQFNNVDIREGDRLLSYLPLAHIFDRVNEEWFLAIGGTIGYWQGDVMKLVDDIAALQPSLFIGVPRVFDRIYTRIMSQINTSLIKKSLFNYGYNRKLFFLRQGCSLTKASPVFDKVVFKKVAARFGGKVKAVVSGGAPLAPHVEDFLRVVMCAPVVQGYGLTETCAASFIASADVMEHAATVGPPTPMTEFRLESVPDMKCNALDPVEPRGEVLIRGAANFTGYYKAADKTDEVLEKDGWFHTGDIAILTPTGAIKIVDRKKNIFKLSQGEYVAVEQLESTYKKAPVVDQVWVYGNSFESCLVSVVVPNKDAILAWAKEAGVPGEFDKGLLEDARTKAFVFGELTRVGKEDKLKGYEIVKEVLLECVPFSVEEDLMTPSFKLRRPQLQAKYQKQIDEMYAQTKVEAAKATKE